MSAAKQLGSLGWPVDKDWRKVPDGMRFLESHMNEIIAKVDRIDEIVGHLEAMLFHELMVRVDPRR